MTTGYRIGVDIGGTSIKAGLVAENGRIVDYLEEMTPREPDEGVAVITHMVGKWTAETEHEIGVAAPGPIDVGHGKFLDPPNLPNWHGYELIRVLEERIGRVCLFENDANAAAVGEYLAGAGKGSSSLAYVTISTGIGAGFIVGKSILVGAQSNAGEVGNMIIADHGPDSKGTNIGSWESLASGTALHHIVKDKLGADGGAETLFKQVQEGNKEAKVIFNTWLEHVASGLANIIHTINPQVILLGGGVMKADSLILDELIAAVKRKVYESLKDYIDIRKASLTHVGVVGASQLGIVKRI
ncbi:ROK family protein [Paenalkalicoccus suaedae]|uniref:ROK family protein n=1 Tax=Paenalkalicoccus suaedae TaxID=2592382 RepID=A0A859FHZ7_9BACI|nr:ROK family protein [Paenalkalicoccus suaedae]QKS72440.1 ROK family protein [Paenalkalicoccus suaedae]